MKHLFVWVLIKCCAYNSLPINGVLSERFLFCTDQIFKQTMFCELSITALVPFISIRWETMYIKALFIRGYWICFDCSKKYIFTCHANRRRRSVVLWRKYQKHRAWDWRECDRWGSGVQKITFCLYLCSYSLGWLRRANTNIVLKAKKITYSKSSGL